MNVLSVCMTYPSVARPWQGTFVRRRIEAMSRRMDVRVLAARPWPAGSCRYVKQTDFDGYEITDTVPTVRTAFLRMPGPLKFCDPWFYARAIRRELRGSSTFTPDVMDAHFEWPDGPAAVQAGARLGLPVVVTLRGKLRSHAGDSIRGAQIRNMLQRADAVIAVSRQLADDAVDLIGHDRPIHVIPNGIDKDVYHPRDPRTMHAELGLDAEALYIVSVGHLQSLKGFDRLIEIMPRVRQACGDVRLLLIGGSVGEPEYERRLLSLIQQHRLDSCIRMIGRVPPETTARYLAAADLFALASRAEGWCNAIHESLACGTPVIATDVGGNRELVRSDGDGLLTTFGDDEALTDAVIRCLGTAWQRDEIAARASKRTWDDVAREVHDVLEDVKVKRCTQGS